jgi:predicted dehydrogenase
VKDRHLSLAIIGAGNIATRHLANLEFMGGSRVVGVCDIDPSRAEDMARRAGAASYVDFAEMFRREAELDAVVLCTPPSVRRAVFELAAERRVSVFCEKPPADTLDEAHRISRLVRDKGLISSVGFYMRYSPAVDRFRELTEGRPVNVVFSTFMGSAALTGGLDDWFFIKERSGGHIIDQAIHHIDLIRFVAGEISKVQTFGNNVICPKTERFTIEDTTCTNMRFTSGASGLHIHSWASPRSMSDLVIVGGDFSLSLSPHSPPRVHGTLGRPGGKQEAIDETFPQGPPMGRSGQVPKDRRPEDPPDPPHYEEMKVFLDAVRRGDDRQIRSSYADAVKSLSVVLAMNQSIESGGVEAVEGGVS